MTQTEIPQYQAAQLIPRLTNDQGYSLQGAMDIAARLVNASPAVKRVFWRWWETGHIDDTLEIEGYTAARIVAKHGVKPPAAFSTLDLLGRDPARALAALNQKRDRVTFRSPPGSLLSDE